jgi:hypothetical protein
MKFISTTALAKEREIEPKELFSKLSHLGWMYKKDDKWQLTSEGKNAGGEIKKTKDLIEYVAWPSSINFEEKKTSKITFTATKIAEKLDISNRKVNLYLTDLGWITKDKGGRVVTEEGKKNGGVQRTLADGIPYVVWEESIFENHHFVRAKKIAEGELIEDFQKTGVPISDDFRLKIPANHRTTDGHYVRSRAEMLIDNFLYYNKIIHAYEKKVNIEEPLFCDFFIPNYNIYIEFWGMDENVKYAERKKRKQELYAKYNFKLIEISDKDLENLDEILATKLRIHNVHVD